MERIVKPVYFTSRALKDFEKLFRFNCQLYGFIIAREINSKIITHIEILENPLYNFSKIGSIDEEFLHFKRNYRKIIEQQYKITYREGKTKIYINRIFDTRQNPNKNK